MQRILLDTYFFDDPTQENYDELERELTIALKNGLIHSDVYKKILADRKKRIINKCPKDG